MHFFSLLQRGIIHNQIEAIGLLLDDGQKDEHALHLAVQLDRVEIVKMLLEKGFSDDYALYRAEKNNKTELVKMLKDAGMKSIMN